jgi:glycosyltransferase involved in cell wall biosynthesis
VIEAAVTPAPISEPRIHVVIPALDEEKSIGLVLGDLPWDLIATVTVGDNGSRDRTAEIATDAGAKVVPATRRGYGSACLAALAALPPTDTPHREIVVFLDADYSDHPDDLPELIAPIATGAALLVIGTRRNPRCEPGALLPQARFGNVLATVLIEVIHGVRFTDLGPFRAIRRDALDALEMSDPDFGWTVEMQVKAAERRFASTEVPVGYRRRVGRSKITGTLRGTFLAGKKILGVILGRAVRRKFEELW